MLTQAFNHTVTHTTQFCFARQPRRYEELMELPDICRRAYAVYRCKGLEIRWAAEVEKIEWRMSQDALDAALRLRDFVVPAMSIGDAEDILARGLGTHVWAPFIGANVDWPMLAYIPRSSLEAALPSLDRRMVCAVETCGIGQDALPVSVENAGKRQAAAVQWAARVITTGEQLRPDDPRMYQQQVHLVNEAGR